MLLPECGGLSLLVRWWVQDLKVWYRMARLPESRLLHHVFRADVGLAAKKKELLVRLGTCIPWGLGCITNELGKYQQHGGASQHPNWKL